MKYVLFAVALLFLSTNYLEAVTLDELLTPTANPIPALNNVRDEDLIPRQLSPEVRRILAELAEEGIELFPIIQEGDTLRLDTRTRAQRRAAAAPTVGPAGAAPGPVP
ncbi:hypothetical protein SNEBB_004043 [Seison nebaliae]|nr:hypothetical protein SNEBB_004043 [Seison nebaliae]